MHLLPDSLQDRQHFHDDATGNDHQVALPWAEPEDLRSEPGQVVLGRAGGHELNPTACSGKWHWPEAVLAAPAGQFVEPADNDIFR
jgi:hypothetical protein